MTLWRCLRLRGGWALPFVLAAALLPACVPGSSGSSTASPSPQATSTPQAHATAPLHVGTVHLERPKESTIVSVPVHTVAPATLRPVVVHTANAKPAGALAASSPYVFASPHAPPQILTVNLSSVEISSGETVSGTVETTSNVASLEARISGWSMSVPRTRIGHFEASGQLPDIPFFLKGSYTLQLIARNADGELTERDVPIVVR
jgi:hypothetical protein